MKILNINPTALNYRGRPIKQRRIHLPGLTLPILAAVTPQDVNLGLVLETVEDIPYDEHWDLGSLAGMGSGVARARQIAEQFGSRGATVVLGGIGATLGPPEGSLEKTCLTTVVCQSYHTLARGPALGANHSLSWQTRVFQNWDPKCERL